MLVNSIWDLNLVQTPEIEPTRVGIFRVVLRSMVAQIEILQFVLEPGRSVLGLVGSGRVDCKNIAFI